MKDPELANKLGSLQNSFGAILGVQDAWLVMRGLKTLSVRMEHSQKGAQKMANLFKRASTCERSILSRTNRSSTI